MLFRKFSIVGLALMVASTFTSAIYSAWEKPNELAGPGRLMNSSTDNSGHRTCKPDVNANACNPSDSDHTTTTHPEEDETSSIPRNSSGGKHSSCSPA